jgi:hypothetical protein
MQCKDLNSSQKKFFPANTAESISTVFDQCGIITPLLESSGARFDPLLDCAVESFLLHGTFFQGGTILLAAFLEHAFKSLRCKLQGES